MHIGATEEADAQSDVGLVVVVDADYLCYIVAFWEVFNADIFSDSEVCSCEVDVSFFLFKHLPEEVDLILAYAGVFVLSLASRSFSGWVAHQAGDVRHAFHDDSVLFLHSNEDNGWDNHLLHHSAFSSAPSVNLFPGGSECLKAIVNEVVADRLLRSWMNPKDVPFDGRRKMEDGRWCHGRWKR